MTGDPVELGFGSTSTWEGVATTPRRVMFVQLKTGCHVDQGSSWIGSVEFNRSRGRRGIGSEGCGGRRDTLPGREHG